jgi:hypothetical protein
VWRAIDSQPFSTSVGTFDELPDITNVENDLISIGYLSFWPGKTPKLACSHGKRALVAELPTSSVREKKCDCVEQSSSKLFPPGVGNKKQFKFTVVSQNSV